MKVDSATDKSAQRPERVTHNDNHGNAFSNMLQEAMHAEGSEEMQSRVHKEQVSKDTGPADEHRLRILGPCENHELALKDMDQTLAEREQEQAVMSRESAKQNAEAQEEALTGGAGSKDDKKLEKDLLSPPKTSKTSTSKKEPKVDGLISTQEQTLETVQTTLEAEQSDNHSSSDHGEDTEEHGESKGEHEDGYIEQDPKE